MPPAPRAAVCAGTTSAHARTRFPRNTQGLTPNVFIFCILSASSSSVFPLASSFRLRIRRRSNPRSRGGIVAAGPRRIRVPRPVPHRLRLTRRRRGYMFPHVGIGAARILGIVVTRCRISNFPETSGTSWTISTTVTTAISAFPTVPSRFFHACGDMSGMSPLSFALCSVW